MICVKEIMQVRIGGNPAPHLTISVIGSYLKMLPLRGFARQSEYPLPKKLIFYYSCLHTTLNLCLSA